MFVHQDLADLRGRATVNLSAKATTGMAATPLRRRFFSYASLSGADERRRVKATDRDKAHPNAGLAVGLRWSGL
jgi:hypothetical protein